MSKAEQAFYDAALIALFTAYRADRKNTTVQEDYERASQEALELVKLRGDA